MNYDLILHIYLLLVVVLSLGEIGLWLLDYMIIQGYDYYMSEKYLEKEIRHAFPISFLALLLQDVLNGFKTLHYQYSESLAFSTLEKIRSKRETGLICSLMLSRNSRAICFALGSVIVIESNPCRSACLIWKRSRSAMMFARCLFMAKSPPLKWWFP
jgi:hypothetical protein